jgi:hypothetical protein
VASKSVPTGDRDRLPPLHQRRQRASHGSNFCLNGCIPFSLLLQSASILDGIKWSARSGTNGERPSETFHEWDGGKRGGRRQPHPRTIEPPKRSEERQSTGHSPTERVGQYIQYSTYRSTSDSTASSVLSRLGKLIKLLRTVDVPVEAFMFPCPCKTSRLRRDKSVESVKPRPGSMCIILSFAKRGLL